VGDKRSVSTAADNPRVLHPSPPADSTEPATATEDAAAASLRAERSMGAGPAALRPPLVVTPRADRPIVPSEPVQPAPALRSKVQPPPLRTSTLSRQRLLDRLANATKGRVTLVVADAGYGKSTLLADFSRRFDGVCLWYTLESDDFDWLTLVPHLVAAAREVQPTFGALTTSLLRAEPGMAPPKSAVVSGFLSELESLHDGRVLMIFDDVHTIEESPDANELLERLVRQAPARFSFVYAGRRRPAIPLALWNGRGEMAELTTDDLRFSRDETARLFADCYGAPLEPVVLDELEARTQGWAACLQLFSALTAGASPVGVRTAAQSLSGASGAVFEYLAQEVMAKLQQPLRLFLTRASILQRLTDDALLALFPEHHPDVARAWADEADALGLLTRRGNALGGRQFHPMLKDYLSTELRRIHSADEVTAFHAAVARAVEVDPLTACYHYLEAGLAADAMRCLSASTLQTLGSGLWGTASRLTERLGAIPLAGGAAVIRARSLLHDGDLEGANQVLQSIDVPDEPPSVRAALRQTAISLAWRSRDVARLLATVQEVLADPETPDLLRDIAQVFWDDSDRAGVSRATLASRLARMAQAQRANGYAYYAAISLHNAAIAARYTARLEDALTYGAAALEMHGTLAVRPAEYYSTLALLAHTCLELGRRSDAEQYMREALAGSGQEEADVPASVAFLFAVTGDKPRARRLLDAAEAVERAGKSDFSARAEYMLALSALDLPAGARRVVGALAAEQTAFPLDFEAEGIAVMLSLAMYVAGDLAGAGLAAEAALEQAQQRGGRSAEVRLAVIRALAREARGELRAAIITAAETSELALLELADAIGRGLHLVTPVPVELESSIERWKDRWLPVLRAAMDLGNHPAAHVAAELLDKHGARDDVARLRAFDKTYRRRSSGTGLGRNLAKRVSPRLRIRDLGHGRLEIGDRLVPLARVRRRSGALLLYLVTRPNCTATREQVIEDLWPDGDLSAGTNSLNQSLYFLRREVDTWYEDDVSPQYITFEAELIALDADLVRADSREFVARSRALMSGGAEPAEIQQLLDSYRGHFAPEFEYEEWAMAWRSRVHAAYLDFARYAISAFVRADRLKPACDAALATLGVDPQASDVERSLIWLYWRIGATSAAERQYAHWAREQRADGFSADPLSLVVAGAEP
jgi:LuxR family transcriptional regulator, maltose regulon positive regulatory protein